MKQKQIKQVANGSKAVKKPPPKKFKKYVDKIVEDDEVTQKKTFGKKIVTKVQKKVAVEEPSEDEEIDESDEIVDEDGENMNASEEDADEDNENKEEMEDSDENDGEEMKDSDENGEEEMDDDEKPFETAIEKEEPTIPSQVKNGPISVLVPVSKIVCVKNLPKQCKQIDIVEVFAKYGAIDQIHLQPNRFGTVANVAFKTENAAEAALAANKTVKVNGSLISVRKKFSNKQETPDSKAESANVEYTIDDNRPRTVYVCRLTKDTTEDQIRELFVSCGEIDRVNLGNKKTLSYAFVTFKDVSSKANAIKLHNTILNGVSIGVFENFKESRDPRDPKRTLVIQNKQSFESIEAHKLEDIFSKCGEIDHLDIFCGKKMLGLITFKTNEAAEEALKLSGKTVQGIELELNKYICHDRNKTTIFVSNIDKSVIEEELWELFSTAGEIENISLKPGFAFINFRDSDSFCKSFLLNETLIKNRMIFIEPHSLHKRGLKRKDRKQGFKPPAKKGKFGAFTTKKHRNA